MSAANPASRRSSFRATTQEPNMYKENSPSPENNDATLFVEEDRRMRRRGSQLYVVIAVVIVFHLFIDPFPYETHIHTHALHMVYFCIDSMVFIICFSLTLDRILVRFEIELHSAPMQIN